jgi:hypothetical protein
VVREELKTLNRTEALDASPAESSDTPIHQIRSDSIGTRSNGTLDRYYCK